jgi:hypothetical protein
MLTSQITSILDTTASLVDAVIQSALQHLMVERQAAETSRAAADRAAQAEVSRKLQNCRTLRGNMG